MQVRIQPVLTQLHANLDSGDVAGVRQRFGDGDHAQALVVVDLHAENVDCAVLAVNFVVGRDQVLVDGRRVSHDLENGAWFVDVADRAVLQRFRGDAIEDVGIECRPIDQRQNFTGARILDDHGSSNGLRVLHALIQFFFGDVLDRLVDGQNQVLSWIRRAFHAVELRPSGVDRDHLLPGNAAKIVIKLALESA